MSLHSSMSPKAIFNRMNRDQSSSHEPFDLRRELNREYTSCMVIIRPIEQKKTKWTQAEMSLYLRFSAKMSEVAEQLELLNLCDFIQEFDAENLKKAIEAFDAETQHMKAEAE